MTDKRIVLKYNKPSDNESVFYSDIADLDLSKVMSESKRIDLLNILHSDDPDHYSRLWFVGFLQYVGYTVDQICNIIDQGASWSDYDSKITWLHVQSVFRSAGRSSPISLQVVSLPNFLYSSNKESGYTPTRYKPPCTIKFTECRNCPDLSICGVR